MRGTDRRRPLMNIDYSKLVSYLAILLVFFFTLFQISTEAHQLPWYLVGWLSFLSFGGVALFAYASYSNYKEILELENQLGLSRISTPSGLFSQWKDKKAKEREISSYLKLAIWTLGLSSFDMLLVNLNLADFVKNAMLVVLN